MTEREMTKTEFEERKNMTMEKHFDQARAEAFVGRLMADLNGAATMIMASIGHRTGLFDAMADLEPSSSADVAIAANLDERYVREWLAAMTVGGIVEYDPEENTYHLPAEHAAWLTRGADKNFAITAQFVPLIASVEDEVIESFETGEGVPYSAFPRFHEAMAEFSGETVVEALTEQILPLVSGLTERLGEGIEVLDVGSGRGQAMNRLASEFPNSRFTGYDLSEEAVATARAEAEVNGISNVRFEVKDVAEIGKVGEYDLITAFDAIHDQAHPGAVLEGVADALKDDGVYLMQDFAGSSHLHKNMDHPIGTYLYTVSTMHCMSVSLAQGGDGLGTMWGEELAREMLADAGFSNVEVKQHPYDPFNNYFIITKS